MFSKAIKLIESKSYDEATTLLHSLSHTDDAKVTAKANYLIGYINTRWDNEDKDTLLAQRSLLANINSEFPLPHAYVLYANISDDINVAINYLKKGIQRFPKEQELYKALLHLSNSRDAVIEEIQNQGLCDALLLGDVISYLITIQRWDEIAKFAYCIRNGNELDIEDDMYLTLIEAYTHLFSKVPDYTLAQEKFSKVLAWDTNNQFAYSHYIGIIYAYINMGSSEKATEYFDRLPISNSIYDLTDMHYPMGIFFEFEVVYKAIFDKIKELFLNDSKRKKKACVLYVLYLYYPSEVFGDYRYKKADAALLSNYLKNEFNVKVGTALYHMRCHFGQFQDAYEVVWTFMKNYKGFEEEDIFLSEVLENASNSDIEEIVKSTHMHLEQDNFDSEYFEQIVFPELIKCLHSQKLYAHVRTIAQYVSLTAIIESDCAFECAYAYGDVDDNRAVEIYVEIIKKDSSCCAATNNLGVQYEHGRNYYKALDCFKRAVKLCPSGELYTRNYKRVYDLIQNSMGENVTRVRSAISAKALKAIGYTVEFCESIYSVKDDSMRDILMRDLQECAIAVVAGQDKLASIMCGSIIEALLMQKIRECSVDKYDLTEISKKGNAANYPVSDMGLNELLYVANKEQMISKNSYHLGHYIRDYRNIVHPAKEMRMKEEISHETVLTMWSVLKQITADLFSKM